MEHASVHSRSQRRTISPPDFGFCHCGERATYRAGTLRACDLHAPSSNAPQRDLVEARDRLKRRATLRRHSGRVVDRAQLAADIATIERFVRSSESGR
jgi:hypothetical protein